MLQNKKKDRLYLHPESLDFVCWYFVRSYFAPCSLVDAGKILVIPPYNGKRALTHSIFSECCTFLDKEIRLHFLLGLYGDSVFLPAMFFTLLEPYVLTYVVTYLLGGQLD